MSSACILNLLILFNYILVCNVAFSMLEEVIMLTLGLSLVPRVSSLSCLPSRSSLLCPVFSSCSSLIDVSYSLFAFLVVVDTIPLQAIGCDDRICQSLKKREDTYQVRSTAVLPA